MIRSFSKALLIAKRSLFLIAVALLLLTAVTPGASASTNSNWTRRNPSPQGNALHSVIFGNNIFVAVGEVGTILTSSDGNTWANQVISGSTALYTAITNSLRLVMAAPLLNQLTASPGLGAIREQIAGCLESRTAITDL